MQKKKMKQVTFESPSKLTSIKESVFESCLLLAKISIPPSVTSIGKLCFLECKCLKEVVIPSSATIGEDAFDSSTKVLKT